MHDGHAYFHPLHQNGYFKNNTSVPAFLETAKLIYLLLRQDEYFVPGRDVLQGFLSNIRMTIRKI